MKRGPKPQSKVKIKWSPDFAYAIGLITTDGNLSKDGRHFDFTSKDKEQIRNFKKCLGLKVKIGHKKSGFKGQKVFRVQFGDVNFYRFLLTIGLMANKSKILSAIKIPNKYFFDFLRGCFDGDGHSYSYWDKRWKSSFMFYTVFNSASKTHIEWLQERIYILLGIKGHITVGGREKICYQLKYAKKESLRILKKLYYSSDLVYLKRKYLKIKKALVIMGASI